MVSFWPFRGQDNSAASFEKELSQQTAKINTASAQNERFRSNGRRYKALWLLYTSVVYIVISLIFVLVIGWQSWTATEYTIVAGGPVLIYGVRAALDAYYSYRIANSQSRLAELYKQRDASIEKLKAATKYNSTQQLLDKYGKKAPGEDTPSKPKKDAKGGQQGNKQQPQPQVQRTGFAPPPTANISRPGQPSPPQQGPDVKIPSPPHQRLPSAPSSPDPTAEFAPNAFTSPPASQAQQYQPPAGPAWYDRLMDLVLGDDETQAKNRIALICQSCRLVNGQAPPGARTAEEIGLWRCSNCKTMNGVESEAKKMMQEITASVVDEPDSPSKDDEVQSGNDEGEDEEVKVERRKTRSAS